MRIVSVVGARPQFVKAAALSARIRKEHEEILVHSGQHYDYQLSGVFFDTLELPRPEVHLAVGSGSHAEQTARVMVALEPVLIDRRPDLLLVYGDTNTTLASALTAAKLGIPIAHVEAGVRSDRWDMPEEVNRVLTDRVATLLFAPTRTALDNLAKEGIAGGVHWVGDVMYDLFLQAKGTAETKSTVAQCGPGRACHECPFGFAPAGCPLHRGEPFAILTVHRAENADAEWRLRGILDAVSSLPVTVLYPVHPRSEKVLKQVIPSFPSPAGSKLLFTPPLAYLDMIALLGRARAVLTDSGGLQKEAMFAQVPCVTLRAETEWPETVASGWNILADADPDRITSAARQVLSGSRAASSKELAEAFGGGRAVDRIVAVLREWRVPR